ncbi:hypothetical protein [Streptomyces ortus]|uniref:Uncharacterized protein n=1 Tax=Streptomyces ortus TaxID=2867268 RepID=A0ABT3UYM4_9ACTN|nr:hypothetical protein [Streptomyces ortus]MCX4231784.1 hypothetical protein [Streptomyces ortus]
MKDLEGIASELQRAHLEGKDAVELANLCREKLGSGFGVISFIATFRIAFDIPLPALQRAQAWHGFEFGEGRISDDEFSTILAPWLMK